MFLIHSRLFLYVTLPYRMAIRLFPCTFSFFCYLHMVPIKTCIFNIRILVEVIIEFSVPNLKMEFEWTYTGEFMMTLWVGLGLVQIVPEGVSIF